jgi:hypothetical protein
VLDIIGGAEFIHCSVVEVAPSIGHQGVRHRKFVADMAQGIRRCLRCSSCFELVSPHEMREDVDIQTGILKSAFAKGSDK